MKAFAVLGVIGLVLCNLSGCGSSDPEAAIKERLRCLNDATEAFSAVKDEKTALSARSRLMEVLRRMVKLNREGTGAPERDESDLRLKNQEAFNEALARLNTAMEHASTVPAGAEVVHEFNYKVHQGLN